MEESISNNRIKSSPSILSEISVQSSVPHFTLCPKLPRCTLAFMFCLCIFGGEKIDSDSDSDSDLDMTKDSGYYTNIDCS